MKTRTLTAITLALGPIAAALTAGDVNLTHTVIGGGGLGDPVAQSGRWTFDILSDIQRQPASNCENSMFSPYGELLINHGWNMSPSSNQPAGIDWLEPNESQDLGGGVMRFDDPLFGGFHPGHLAMMQSPPIPGEMLRIETGDFIEMSFTALSDDLPPQMVFVVGMRVMVDGGWGPWEEYELPILPGQHDYRVAFGTEVNETTDAVQTELGVQNTDETTPVPGEGPKVDDVTTETTTTGERVTHNVPDISQGDEAICQASAFANCLSWWGSNGYPELTPGATQKEKNEKLQGELKKKCHTEGKGDAGVTGYLKEKKVYKGQAQTGTRPQLEHVRRSGKNATWDWLKEQFAAGHDVLIRVQWYNEDGELVDADAAHYMTVAQVREGEDGKKTILVANPWGDSTHEVGDANKAEAYDELDATCNEDGTIRIDNDDLENNAAGIEGAAYLCVTDINVIRPVAAAGGGGGGGGRVAGTPDMFTVTSFAGPAGDTTYNYTITNTGDDPITFVVLDFEVPWANAQGPADWLSEALPTLLPSDSGCGAHIGGTGVAWRTDGVGILPGESLAGFLVDIPAQFPLASLAVIGLTDNGESGQYELAPAPAPILGDIDGDGDVDFADLVLLLAAWGPCGGADCPADLDGDGIVGFTDLVILLANWS